MSSSGPPRGPLGFEDDDEAGREPAAPPDPPDRRWPGDDVELGAGPPPRLDAPPPARRRARNSTSIAVLVGLAIVIYISINTLHNRGRGPGSKGPAVGSLAHPFAAPLAVGSLEGSVNVATKDHQGAAGKVPACSVTVPGSVNACRMWRRSPVVLAFFVTRGPKCVREVDRLVPVARRHPGVQVLAIALRGDRGDVRDLVRSHRWRFPVAYDEDGRLANFYGVAVCPQLTYVRRGGTVAGTNVGDLSRERLERQVAALEAGRRVR